MKILLTYVKIVILFFVLCAQNVFGREEIDSEYKFVTKFMLIWESYVPSVRIPLPDYPGLYHDWALLNLLLHKIDLLNSRIYPFSRVEVAELQSKERLKLRKLLSRFPKLNTTVILKKNIKFNTTLHASFKDISLLRIHIANFLTNMKFLKNPEKGEKEEAFYSPNDNSFQPFLRYLPATYVSSKKYPLIVFLHGYAPYLNIFNWDAIPGNLKRLAEEMDFCILVPFGRGNTDFQGLGELDVLQAMREMCLRYNIDHTKIFLIGISMGGSGVWTVAAHNPSLFAGLVVISARGDFYFWHNIERNKIPEYKRILIDNEFGFSLVKKLASLPILNVHGTRDRVVNVREARHMARRIALYNPYYKYVEICNGDHWIYENVFESKFMKEWLRGQLNKKNNKSSVSMINIAEIIEHVPRSGAFKYIFMRPFIFVDCGKPLAPLPFSFNFICAVTDYYYAFQTFPMIVKEDNVTEHIKHNYNLILIAGDKNSKLINEVLKSRETMAKKNLISVNQYHKKNLVSKCPFDSTKLIGVLTKFKKKLPHDQGVIVMFPNPWNINFSIAIQKGVCWGKYTPINHKYDFIPEYIIYSDSPDTEDPYHSNHILDAGFLFR